MKKLFILVPVSPFESELVIEKSISCLKKLDLENLKAEIIYLVDSLHKKDERLKIFKKYRIKFLREVGRKGRGSALNRGLKYIKKFNPDFVVFFDIDSRPAKNFIKECLKKFEKDVFIVSTGRKISNENSIFSKIGKIEWSIFNFFLRIRYLKFFNGVIGVVRAEPLLSYRFDEKILVEDTELQIRAYLDNWRNEFTNRTFIEEQFPMSFKDLFNQKVRWYFGFLQVARKYFKKILFSKNIRFKFEFLSLFLCYFPILLLPALFLVFPLFLIYCKVRNGMKIFTIFLITLLIYQTASIYAFKKFLEGKSVEWKPIKREII